jgi:hypothetical protein
MLDLGKITDVELQTMLHELLAEQKLRETAHTQRETLRRKERGEFIVRHVDVLLDLVRDHQRSGCDDWRPENYDHCLRCALLDAKDTKIWNVHLDVRITLMVDSCKD